MVSKAQKKAIKKWQDNNKDRIKEYQKKKYDFLKIRFNKGDADKVKENAKSENKSINQYCVDKIMGE